MTENGWKVVDVVMSLYGHPAVTTYRLPVPGGWLYRVEDGDEQAVVFVPMPMSVAYPGAQIGTADDLAALEQRSLEKRS